MQQARGHRPGLPSAKDEQLIRKEPRVGCGQTRRKSMAHPNEDLLRRGYDAFGTGDMETLAALLADDIVWHFPAATRSPETTRGGTRFWLSSSRVSK